MKPLFLYFLFAACSTFAVAQTKQTVTKADVSYSIKNMGFNSTGELGGLEAVIMFDKDHLATSSIEASVSTKSINSGDDMRDNHLKKEEYFDVDHYPKITMKSVAFKSAGGNKYIGSFDVTIKGKTKRLDVPFTYVINGSTAAFNGSFKINRLDFTVGDKSMVLSNEVTISLKVETAL